MENVIKFEMLSFLLMLASSCAAFTEIQCKSLLKVLQLGFNDYYVHGASPTTYPLLPEFIDKSDKILLPQISAVLRA